MRKSVSILILLLLVAGLLVGAIASPASATTTSFTPTADSHLSKNNGTTNYGTITPHSLRGPGTFEKWGLYKFNISLPAGETFASATVSFKVHTTGTGKLHLYAAPSAGWTEAGVTWNTKPTIGTMLDTKPLPALSGTVVTFTVPGVVVSGDNSFYLQTTETAADVKIYSNDAGAANRPSLAVVSDANPGGCLLTSNYASVQAAVNAASANGCVDINSTYTQSSTVTVNKALTVRCVTNGHGLSATSGVFALFTITSSSVKIKGCTLTGHGVTDDMVGVSFDGATLSNIDLVGLTVKDIETGTVGDSGVQSDIEVANSLFDNIGGTGTAWYYGDETDDIRLLRNVYRSTQRNGTAGQAAIQSGGSPDLRHHNWTIQQNSIDNSVCGAADQVDIGLDQITDTLIDDNLVQHCNSWGEGIVANGPRNTISNNEVRGVRNGSITLITYPGLAQHVRDVTVSDNLVVGPGLSGGQGIALSFPPSADSMTNVQILRNKISGHPYGIQAYGYNGGTVLAGSSNVIQDNDLNGNSSGACNMSAFSYTASGNSPTC